MKFISVKVENVYSDGGFSKASFNVNRIDGFVKTGEMCKLIVNGEIYYTRESYEEIYHMISQG